jgi:hypothetical protein
MSLSKAVAFLVSLAGIGHAVLGLLSGKITLRGGSEIVLKNEPLSFFIIITIELVASLYIFWAFFIAKDKESESDIRRIK